ncbi:MAG: hypothetical protein DSM107014_03740 [Gomphosphaeria aponina SAG 52.96 = DSM 107014]|uniref:Uncharacterized protein n=1 Tax=Gomphosphaeria aponina SAG 52.96 = DSM 107014 TaxID=1521640 RepID=A0A941GS38_9CHRO|nr:hypothetical protein [Gomphosphaeria aponina SAG 52.96 = DSM 107014]
MVNRIVPGNNNLVFVDYGDLLQHIWRAIRDEELFKVSGDRLRLNIDLDKIATKVVNASPQTPVLEPEYHARMATVNFTQEFRERFPGKIRELRDCLKKKLENYLLGENLPIANLLDTLITDLTDYQNREAKLDFSYPFPSHCKLVKQRLSLQKEGGGSNSLLKFHKVTLTVQNINGFDTELKAGLENFIKEQDDNDREELEDILKEITKDTNDPNSDFYRVKRLVDTEVVGQLKREAKIIYLEYLNSNINAQKHPEVIYLQDLIRRLRLINDYLNHPENPDDHYVINYQGVEVDLRQLLSQSHIFDALPIIPIVGGNIGETTDKEKGRREFTFGLKLKLNGKVEARGGVTAFRYYLNLIDPESKEHQAELKNNKEKFIKKVFSVFFVYYFVCASRCEPNKPGYNLRDELQFDPVKSWKSNYLKTFQGDDEVGKTKLLKTVNDYFLGQQNDTVKIQLQIESKIAKLVKLLKNFIKHLPRYSSAEYPKHIIIYKGILQNNIESILETNTFFQKVVRENPKKSLQYLSLEEAEVNSNALLALPAIIKIEDIRYIRMPEKQEFSMEYDLGGIKALPVLFVPKHNTGREQYKNFNQRSLVTFPFTLENGQLSSQQYFTYCFTFFLLVYICLKILLDEAKEQLFVPILRFHLKRRNKSEEKQDLDQQIGNYSKVLAHLLNEEHLANSQGFDITNLNNYKNLNGMSSLYAVIPKNFHFSNPQDQPKLDKLVIMIVSSRECDAKKGNPNRDERISNLVGEIVTVNRRDNGIIQLRKWKSLSENYPTAEMYRQPVVISDAVSNLYREGYRHFLYIAQTPFTDTLNLTQQTDGDNDQLFFHSKNIIRYLYQQHHEIKLYPIFFDKYYVRKLDEKLTTSLYIQDTKELMGLVNDPSQQAVVFFNLFNGITVGKGDDRIYNGVISYATLLNVYQEFLDEKGLRQLVDDTEIKNDILQYLTLLHFSRYEKSRDLSLKLEPYQGIIGDDSVGKLALFKHMNGQAEFNSLAFLTEVKKALWSF